MESLVHSNVLVTFSYFITYGNTTLYCATQTLALIGSTIAFPPPSQVYKPTFDQVVYRDKDNALARGSLEATGRT